ncbi:MAG: hypothetical protein JST82_00770 [Bacteroidetes bacterium]|nr:hypothetical protein [Bacteroidota bacterium]
MIRLLKVLLLLCMPLASYAQWDIGVAADISFPMMFNKYVKDYNHSSTGLGARININYLPPNATFTPSLNVTVSPYVLPVYKMLTDRVLNMNFTALNAMLQGKVKKQISDKELYFGLGLGATYIGGHSVAVSGDQQTVQQLYVDSAEYIKRILPQAMFSIELVMPISKDKPVYAFFGGQVMYAYVAEQQTGYRIDVMADGTYYKISPKLTGHLMTPSLYVGLYYRFGKTNNR